MDTVQNVNIEIFHDEQTARATELARNQDTKRRNVRLVKADSCVVFEDETFQYSSSQPPVYIVYSEIIG